MLDPRAENELTGGGDTRLHYHLEDRTPTHDTLEGLQNLTNSVSTATNYTVRSQDDQIICTASCTVTLPAAKAQREVEIANYIVLGGTVNVVPTGSDTILGTSGVALTAYTTSIRFKAVTGGWIAI